MSSKDDASRSFVDAARLLAGPECEIFIAQLGGAMGRVPREATAYRRPRRSLRNERARPVAEPERRQAIRSWARRMFDSRAVRDGRRLRELSHRRRVGARRLRLRPELRAPRGS